LRKWTQAFASKETSIQRLQFKKRQVSTSSKVFDRSRIISGLFSRGQTGKHIIANARQIFQNKVVFFHFLGKFPYKIEKKSFYEKFAGRQQ
jgi:hypothetical protein